MGIIEGLAKISGDRYISILFTLLALILPGIGYIYLTNPVLFAEIEFLKLIFLSIFVSFPIFLIGFIYSVINKKCSNAFGYLITAAFFTLVNSYCGFFIYLFIPSVNYWFGIGWIYVLPVLSFGFNLISNFTKNLLRPNKK